MVSRAGFLEHAFNTSTQEPEAGGFLSLSQPGLQRKCQDRQGYIAKFHLEKQKKTKPNKKRKEKRRRKKEREEGRKEEKPMDFWNPC